MTFHLCVKSSSSFQFLKSTGDGKNYTEKCLIIFPRLPLWCRQLTDIDSPTAWSFLGYPFINISMKAVLQGYTIYIWVLLPCSALTPLNTFQLFLCWRFKGTTWFTHFRLNKPLSDPSHITENPLSSRPLKSRKKCVIARWRWLHRTCLFRFVVIQIRSNLLACAAHKPTHLLITQLDIVFWMSL